MNDIKNITEEVNIIQDWNKDKSLSCFFLFSNDIETIDSNSFNINNVYNISKSNLINMEAILNVLNDTIIFDMNYNNDDDNAYILARLNENREWISKNFKQSLFLLLPKSFSNKVQNICPDLWYIRSLSFIY